MSRVALVSCVKSKKRAAAPAADLYTSPLFRSLRQYAEAHADQWYILSAEHGLLRPHQVVAPYEKTLKNMSKLDRLAWAKRVKAQLADVLPPGAEVIVLAGERYRENLLPFLERGGFSVSVPLKGLSFGKQLQQLKEWSSGKPMQASGDPSPDLRAEAAENEASRLVGATRDTKQRHAFGDLPFSKRSSFVSIIAEALDVSPASWRQGHAVEITLAPGGYDGEYRVQIAAGDHDYFCSDWSGADQTRFPTRIRAAATALRDHGDHGDFLISHRDGLLKIIRRT